MKKHKMLVAVISTFLASSLFWALIFSTVYLNDPISRKVGRAYKIIKEKYIFDYDDEVLKDNTISALISSLGDRYSVFYTKEYFSSLMDSLDGHYYGIGINVSANENGEIVVIGIHKDSPSERAGIKEGDILFKVEDIFVTEENLDEAIKKIKVDEKGLGTTVKLTLKRNGEEYETDVLREKVVIHTVESDIIDGDIGYIKIDSFDSETIDEFDIAAEKVKNTNYLILDLRNNGGGTLDSMQHIADALLPECTLTTFEYKTGKNTVIKTSGKQILKMPLYVLVNEKSASASELISAALHDNERATLIGEKTFGKAIAQQPIPFEYSKGAPVSAIYITYAKYLTPNGEYIHGKGILPDIVVEQENDVVLRSEEDVQFKRVIEEINKKRT